MHVRDIQKHVEILNTGDELCCETSHDCMTEEKRCVYAATEMERYRKSIDPSIERVIE